MNHNIFNRISDIYVKNCVNEEIQNLYTYHYHNHIKAYTIMTHLKKLNDVRLCLFDKHKKKYLIDFFIKYHDDEIVEKYIRKYAKCSTYMDSDGIEQDVFDFTNCNVSKISFEDEDIKYIDKLIISYTKKIFYVGRNPPTKILEKK